MFRFQFILEIFVLGLIPAISRAQERPKADTLINYVFENFEKIAFPLRKENYFLLIGLTIDKDSVRMGNVHVYMRDGGAKTYSDSNGFYMLYIPAKDFSRNMDDSLRILCFEKAGYIKEVRTRTYFSPGMFGYLRPIKMDVGDGEHWENF